MERPYVLHLFTPGLQASPFDVNMAADAGWQVIVPYAQVALDGVAALTQDAIFSRGPKGVAKTGIFIGGRDAMLAADMLERAHLALVPPFAVSLFADPSGAFTTAAALVACVESALQRQGVGLAGRRVLLLGGSGPVGRIAAVLCAQAGATAVLGSHKGASAANEAAQLTGARFGVELQGASTSGREALRAALRGADVVLGVAAAGVQVMTEEDRAASANLRVAADVNAVPPEGLAGVGVTDDGVPIAGTEVLGIGALAIGNVKYQVHQRLLARMRESGKPELLSFPEALAEARDVISAKAR